MTYDPIYHHRRSIRLRGYDYSQPGFYFITLLIQNKKPILGKLTEDGIELSELGRLVESRWNRIPEFYPMAKIINLTILPDHIHGIIEITSEELSSSTADIESLFEIRIWKENFLGDAEFKSPSKTIGAFIRGFKFGVSSDYKKLTGQTIKIFQRDYYETIIKDYEAFIEIRNYINNNLAIHKARAKGE